MEIENEGSSETSYQLSEEERWTVIISFKYFNLKQVQICEKYPFATKSNVSKILKKYNETGSVQNKPKSGRPSIIQQHPNISEMVQTVLQDANRVCSSRQELGFKYGRVNMIHKLTDENKVQRLKYCKHAIRNAFHNIIFSDECLSVPPDLNPIELIWNTMKQKFKQKLIIKKFEDNSQLTQENIKEIISEIWQDIDDNIIKQSISHTKKIMKQVIELQGDYCKLYI
ncbi:hypothetical protein ABPG72_013602 [Tetrahymena utriculariae]